MNLFALSFEIMGDNNPAEISKSLVHFLYKNGCKDFKSYLKFTINFYCDKELLALNNLIVNEFGYKISYQLTIISQIGNFPQIHSHYNKSHFRDFQNLVKETISDYPSL